MQLKLPHQVQSINNELLKMNYFDEIDDIYYTSLLRKKVISDEDNYLYIKIQQIIIFLVQQVLQGESYHSLIFI